MFERDVPAAKQERDSLLILRGCQLRREQRRCKQEMRYHLSSHRRPPFLTASRQGWPFALAACPIPLALLYAEWVELSRQEVPVQVRAP